MADFKNIFCRVDKNGNVKEIRYLGNAEYGSIKKKSGI